MNNVVVYQLCRVSVSDILGLRHRVLLPGCPPVFARFEGDGHPKTWHVGRFVRCVEGYRVGEPLSCATFVLSSFMASEKAAWHLRGMATDPAHQGKGFGTDLLEWSMQKIGKQTGITLFWCNARVSAIGFYEKLGWEFMSDEFEIPSVGPHRVMMKEFEVA